MFKKTFFENMSNSLSSVDWPSEFAGCFDVVAIFMSQLEAAFVELIVLIQNTHKEKVCLPKHILKLTRKKNAE